MKNGQLPLQIRGFLNNYLQLLHVQLPLDIIKGVYLYGSIALGAFDENKSDIDFIVLLNRPLNKREVNILKSIHSKMITSPFGKRMDGMYLQMSSLGRNNHDLSQYPYCANGKVKIGHWDINDITWWVLKENGLTLFGTPISNLTIPTQWGNVENTLNYNINHYWKGQLRKPLLFLLDDSVEFMTSTVSRILCSQKEKKIVSKQKAYDYALQEFPEYWHKLLKEGNRIRYSPKSNSYYFSRISRMKDCKDFLLFATKLFNGQI